MGLDPCQDPEETVSYNQVHCAFGYSRLHEVLCPSGIMEGIPSLSFRCRPNLSSMSVVHAVSVPLVARITTLLTGCSLQVNGCCSRSAFSRALACNLSCNSMRRDDPFRVLLPLVELDISPGSARSISGLIRLASRFLMEGTESGGDHASRSSFVRSRSGRFIHLHP